MLNKILLINNTFHIVFCHCTQFTYITKLQLLQHNTQRCRMRQMSDDNEGDADSGPYLFYLDLVV